MTRKQKENILRTTQKDFETRLKELARISREMSYQDRLQLINRKESLSQAINFCNYLQMYLTHNSDFQPENYSMLEFIGLGDLY